MKIVITRKDNGIKEIECAGWCVDAYALKILDAEGMYIYACTDWLDVEVVKESHANSETT